MENTKTHHINMHIGWPIPLCLLYPEKLKTK